MKEYTSVDNDRQLKPGTYLGKWTGYVVKVNDRRQTEIYMNVAVTGMDVVVRLEVDSRKIKVFLD